MENFKENLFETISIIVSEKIKNNATADFIVATIESSVVNYENRYLATTDLSQKIYVENLEQSRELSSGDKVLLIKFKNKYYVISYFDYHSSEQGVIRWREY